MSQQENFSAIRKVQEYLQAHLNERITLQSLAKVSGYSPYHCAHLFKATLGMGPLTYLRKLRLTQASLRIRDHQDPILTIAFDFQFDSHEGFTRAFSRQFGMSPKTYRKNSPPISHFHPFLLPKEPQGAPSMKPNQTVFVHAIERPTRKAIVCRGKKAEDYFEYCEEVSGDVWGILSSVKEALNEPMGMWLPPLLIKPGTSLYVQGVEVPLDYDKPLPEGFEMMDLEPCLYLFFQGEPYNDDDYQEAISQIWDAIDAYQPETFGFKFDPTKGPRIQLEPRGERGYIEAKPVIKL
ncbi:MAG: transcriptional regulator AraC family [Erysipelotrichaceae bacterium]|nr:MAG: transcriptional regulator AraC [Erysipelotrichaceae bacterium]TXT18586.1 MAG: transcriptional regulator AraC family [Erysipelotrichaceae bacterium]